MNYHAFSHLGFLIEGFVERLGLTRGIKDDFFEAIRQSTATNPWFTEANIRQALKAIATRMLLPDELHAWLGQHPAPQGAMPRNVGIIMAGNLPLVGFHDWLCTLCSGHCAVVKLSSKDPFLLPMLNKYLCQIDYRFEGRTRFADTLCGVDAAIATGSNNSARFFESELGAIPHLIRRSRTSIGVVSGSESDEQLLALAHDALDYFGLGCRSVGKIYVPNSYDLQPLQQAFMRLADIRRHDGYNDCCRYAQARRAMYGLQSFIDFGSCIAVFSDELHSAVGEVFLQRYAGCDELGDLLAPLRNELQCVATSTPVAGFEHCCVAFGQTQLPGLTDYADGIDVMDFLSRICEPTASRQPSPAARHASL